ncbi:MAG: hypothetical protein PHQ74_05695 [Crocinitomicaceae bacterium]|nr:hypothetical protein [Crocinitomicaceae bacterium]
MKLFLSLLLSFLIFSSIAQENQAKSFSVSLDVRKIDYFLAIDYHFGVQKLNFAFGLETGIVKTFFQQRFFPGIHAQINYPLLNKNHFFLAPAFDLNYNLLSVQKGSRHPHVFQEYRLGYQLNCGNKLKLIHSAGVGLISEHFYGAYSQKYRSAIGFAYSVKIGCLYAF